MRITRKLLPWRQSINWKSYYSLRNSGKYYKLPCQIESNFNQPENCKVFIRYFGTSSCHSLPFRSETVSLSKNEVNNIIWENENVIVLDADKGVICETNQLASNQPNEDQLFITRSCLNEKDVLVGVIDGHGGRVVGEVIKERLPYYLHSALCNKHLCRENSWTPVDFVENLLDNVVHTNDSWIKDLDSFMEDLRIEENAGRSSSYASRICQLIMGKPQNNVSKEDASPYVGIAETLRTAFMRLDRDLTNEIISLSERGQLNSDNLGLALSGCCAVAAYVMEDELFVANTGDCRAILGTVHNGSWKSIQLTNDHTSAANSDEVQRILGEHPEEEVRTCIQYGRLLGRLAPLRSFGDVQFKLTRRELKSLFKVLPNYKILTGLLSPPYLTAEPDVFHYKLESNDKFLVLASDGLWDMLSNDEVVELVAAYIEGRCVDTLKNKAHLFGVANCNEIINDENAFSDSAYENVASYLIRFALGGYDEEYLRDMLSLPYPIVRNYRDDITVIVLFLNNS